MILRYVGMGITLILALTVGIVVALILGRLWTRWNARRLGASLMPLSMRLESYAGALRPETERRVTELCDAGFVEVGRFVTDRPPRAVVVAFVAADGRMVASAAEHPTLGSYSEVVCRDGEGRSLSVFTGRLPLGAKSPPDGRVIARPGAHVTELVATIERETAAFASHRHTAEGYIREWEADYHRAVRWMYTEGPLRNADPDAQARITGLEVDPETAYFLRIRREERA